MRRLLLLALSVALLVSACSSGGSHHSTKSATTTVVATHNPEKTCATGKSSSALCKPVLDTPQHQPLQSISERYLAADKVGHKSFCSNVDAFCADFPYITSSDDRFSNFTSETLFANPKEATPRFDSYSSHLAWGYVGKMLVFCRLHIDPLCYNPHLTRSGIPADGYSVFVSADQPSKTLDQLDSDCHGWLNRHATSVTMAGESALHVTCNYSSNHHGIHDLYYLRHNGKVYEVAAIDQVHTPFFSQRFFNSFRFAD